MHTMRTRQAGHAEGVPLAATQRCSEWRLDNPTASRARRRHRHKDHRPQAPQDAYLAPLALRPIRQTRAARGDTPGRLFGSQKDVDQTPRREPLTKASGRLGSVSQAHPSHPRPTSLLRVVPFAPPPVKGIAVGDARRPYGDDTLPGPLAAVRWLRARLLPRRLYRERQVWRGGAR